METEFAPITAYEKFEFTGPLAAPGEAPEESRGMS